MWMSRARLKEMEQDAQRLSDRVEELETARFNSLIRRQTGKTLTTGLGYPYPEVDEFTTRDVLEQVLKHLKLDVEKVPEREAVPPSIKIVQTKKQ